MRSRSAPASSPSPGDLDAQAAVLHPRRRLDQEAQALERGEARDREDVVAVFVRPVGPLRGRRVEQLARDAAEALQPRLDRLALRDQTMDVARQQPAVHRMEHAAAHAFLEPSLASQAAREALPQVVVLAHAVVEPADVMPVPDRVRRKAQRDDLVHGLAVRRLADVRQPRRPVGGELAAEAVLRRDHHVRRGNRPSAARPPSPPRWRGGRRGRRARRRSRPGSAWSGSRRGRRLPRPHHACGHAHRDRSRRQVLRHHRARAHHDVIADRHAVHDLGPRAEPDVLAHA